MFKAKMMAIMFGMTVVIPRTMTISRTIRKDILDTELASKKRHCISSFCFFRSLENLRHLFGGQYVLKTLVIIFFSSIPTHPVHCFLFCMQ